ncbi:hypothetical protein SARC_02630 [Sphaeroforma arctica JP610]|uniref:Elongation factor Ts, mitochondrial n=1 Tax=Sphaeroforma arctica JP610 TaxID=667725 RepID=A0A0L0GAA6_9EUKA|nr:hypothetical protein SARC_02630 [Sphaeroforma arctica JP610]KNC85173.1 hypothetical protein SARC_02630 [Sphaeroforma arctica JP610]|eukprot:XP_014159075.1 hypothetical protein SARC_02630 [Sphaeroforma arctica JP610]
MFGLRIASALRLSSGCGGVAFRTQRLFSTPVKVDTKLLSKLRKDTELSMSKCKEALVTAANDYDKALEWLQERMQADGAAKSAKLEGRVAAEGVVGLGISADGLTGTVVEVNCETDFVSKNQEFRELVQTAATQYAMNTQAPLESLDMGDGQTLQTRIDALVGKLGERITARRASVVTAPQDTGVLAGYVHGSKDQCGKIVTMVTLNSEPGSAEVVRPIARQIASHVAGMRPQSVAELLSQDYLFNPDVTVSQFLVNLQTEKSLLQPITVNSIER